MLSVNYENRLGLYKTPYIEYPQHPTEIEIEGFRANAYISPEEVNKYTIEFSKHVSFEWFDFVLVNMNGGRSFAEDLARLQHYSKKIYKIEYHPNGDMPIRIPSAYQDAKIAVIDDVLDTGLTSELIRKDAPFAAMLYLVRKRTPGQIVVHNSACAIEVDDKWLFGRGMNGNIKDDGYPENWGRTYRGIGVKI